MRIGATEAFGENAGRAATTRSTMEDHTFRGCFEHAIVVWAAVYLKSHSRRICEMILAVCSVWRKWSRTMAKEAWGVESVEARWNGQVDSDFMTALFQTIGVLSMSADLQKCTFITSIPPAGGPGRRSL